MRKPPGEIATHFRNRANLSDEDIEKRLGISWRSRGSLETSFEMEHFHELSLVFCYLKVIGASPSEAFSYRSDAARPVSADAFRLCLVAELAIRKLTFEEFATICGWDLQPVSGDPLHILDRPLDCLRDACSSLPVCWIDVVEGLWTWHVDNRIEVPRPSVRRGGIDDRSRPKSN